MTPSRITPARDVDHVTPKARGGTDEPVNLESICRSCHQRKTAEERGYRVPRPVALDGTLL
jgi:5-methylcytosine-specific restriction protein A